MGTNLRRVVEAVFGQQTALSNARGAATALARSRVERDGVDLYLEELLGREHRYQEAAAAYPCTAVRLNPVRRFD
jgi:hypothetical protein